MRRRKLIIGLTAFFSACWSKKEERDSAREDAGSDSAEQVVLETPACESQELSVSLLEHPELRDVGGTVYVSFPEQFVHLLVICVAEEEWVAVWKICTHGVCDVEWDSSLSLVRCPCHGSLFDVDGLVLQGPAVRDLKAYSVCRKDQKLFLLPQDL